MLLAWYIFLVLLVDMIIIKTDMRIYLLDVHSFGTKAISTFHQRRERGGMRPTFYTSCVCKETMNQNKKKTRKEPVSLFIFFLLIYAFICHKNNKYCCLLRIAVPSTMFIYNVHYSFQERKKITGRNIKNITIKLIVMTVLSRPSHFNLCLVNILNGLNEWAKNCLFTLSTWNQESKSNSSMFTDKLALYFCLKMLTMIKNVITICSFCGVNPFHHFSLDSFHFLIWPFSSLSLYLYERVCIWILQYRHYLHICPCYHSLSRNYGI